MIKKIFETEEKMQQWLSSALKINDCFRDLIINADDFDNLVSTTLVETKILKSYQHCLSSLGLVSIISENENISLKNGDILKPDFILYAPETESIVIVELKNLISPSRQVGTEISAYASEIKSYIPFISEGDIVNVIISSTWTALIKHYVFHEIFWLQRNILCLEPCEQAGDVFLKIIDINLLINNDVALKLSPQHLGGYQICMYDYSSQDRNRLDSYLEQMKTAMRAISSKGYTQKNHGFAFLWKDNWGLSPAPYSITILNFAPFNSLERLFHNEKFEPSEILKRFFNIVKEYAPEGHGKSLFEIYSVGEKFLEEFCNPMAEGFLTWDPLKASMTENSTLISFESWGVFGELLSEKLYKEYKNGNTIICSTDPQLGLELIDELIDPSYEFIDLSNHICNLEDENKDPF